MADRKEWELTDEERTEIRAWYCGQGSISLHSRNIFCLADAFAYKGARKALEWAAQHVESRSGLRGTGAWTLCNALSHEIRKELTDG